MSMTRRLAKIAFTVSLSYLIAADVWKPLFIGGWLPGPYWLFIALDSAIPLMVWIGPLVFAVLSVAFLLADTKTGWLATAVKIALGCFSVAIAIASVVWIMLFAIAQHGYHVQTISQPSQTYHLAVYPMFDLNYALYECDSLSIVCGRVYRSGDFVGEYARLVLNDRHHELWVVLSGYQGEEVLYQYPLGP